MHRTMTTSVVVMVVVAAVVVLVFRRQAVLSSLSHSWLQAALRDSRALLFFSSATRRLSVCVWSAGCLKLALYSCSGDSVVHLKNCTSSSSGCRCTMGYVCLHWLCNVGAVQ